MAPTNTGTKRRKTATTGFSAAGKPSLSDAQIRAKLPKDVKEKLVSVSADTRTSFFKFYRGNEKQAVQYLEQSIQAQAAAPSSTISGSLQRQLNQVFVIPAQRPIQATKQADGVGAIFSTAFAHIPSGSPFAPRMK